MKLKKLSQKITKSKEKSKSDLKKLSKEKFACEADAIPALNKLSKQFKYYQIVESQITEQTSENPDEKQEKYYHISAIISQNESKINTETRSAGLLMNHLGLL
ncbi:hypothetical protein [Brasilonema sp. UFV-L1]|uniref:hypothetical protein n=1 Tax=Brasilonema sp. UFV-L1 TaxID=2234130 RepID=UPI00145E768A|nr:hypothetical protein [Brasilonema sp. UFV-L1]NMG09945.1 hypothetical protein [Brasilonema sp. UFV-L1]